MLILANCDLIYSVTDDDVAKNALQNHVYLHNVENVHFMCKIYVKQIGVLGFKGRVCDRRGGGIQVTFFLIVY